MGLRCDSQRDLRLVYQGHVRGDSRRELERDCRGELRRDSRGDFDGDSRNGSGGSRVGSGQPPPAGRDSSSRLGRLGRNDGADAPSRRG